MQKTKYQVEDEEILSAIRYHTTGHPDMTVLEKIIYLADYIEPGRAWTANHIRFRKSGLLVSKIWIMGCALHWKTEFLIFGNKISPLIRFRWKRMNGIRKE